MWVTELVLPGAVVTSVTNLQQWVVPSPSGGLQHWAYHSRVSWGRFPGFTVMIFVLGSGALQYKDIESHPMDYLLVSIPSQNLGAQLFKHPLNPVSISHLGVLTIRGPDSATPLRPGLSEVSVATWN